MPRITLAIAGSGTTSYENVRDLLNDFVSPYGDDVTFIIPVTESHVNESLLLVMDWLDEENWDYKVVTDKGTLMSKDPDIQRILQTSESDALVATNVNKKVVGLLSEITERNAKGANLILLWGDDEEVDANSEILLDLATAKSVPVLDLTQGLDDLTFSDETADADVDEEPDPEPEPEKPVRQEPLVAEDEPLDETPEPEPQTQTQTEPETEPEEKAPPEAEPEPEFAPPSDDTLSEMETFFATSKEETPEQKAVKKQLRYYAMAYASQVGGYLPEGRERSLFLTKVQESLLWALESAGKSQFSVQVVEDETEGPQEPQEAPQEAPARGRGRPRKDGSPAKPRSASQRAVMEIWDADESAWVRKGRGRVPKGAKTRLVNPDSGEIVTD